MVCIYGVHAQTLYVSSSTGNDKNNGNNWNKAFKTLSKAIKFANIDTSIQTIQVASGNYYPSGTSLQTSQNKDSSFTITRSSLKITGGFNITTHKKTDTDSSILIGNNCFHIILVSGLAANADSLVIDGFVITGGFANGLDSEKIKEEKIQKTKGGAIYLSNNANGGKLAIRNCTIRNNYASEGGAIYNSFSSPSITNCTFIGNKVNNIGGGAIFNQSGSPQITNCFFYHNGEGMFGGAIYSIVDLADKIPIHILNCKFTDNMVDQWGGGIYSQGGLVNIANCIFSGNESFANNESTAGGGAVYFNDVTASIANCVFSGNNASNAAGGGIFSEKSLVGIANCTFSGNNAKYGGALCSRGNQSQIKVCNSILYGNSSCIDKYGNGNIAINYSVIDGGYNGLYNYKDDPLFVNAPSFKEAPFCDIKGGHAKYFATDYRLKIGSQAIDTGSKTYYTTFGGLLTDLDYAGKKRFSGNSIDIGAYEYQPDSSNDSNPLMDGSTKNTAPLFDKTKSNR